jgi:hypothetical protein
LERHRQKYSIQKHKPVQKQGDHCIDFFTTLSCQA